MVLKEMADIEHWDEVKICLERGVADCGSFAEYVRKAKGESDGYKLQQI